MPNKPTRHRMGSTGVNHRAQVDQQRANAQAWARQHKRQYRTNSKVWRAIRREQLQHQPFCKHHLDDHGVYRAATHVDHIDGDSFNNDPNNLQSLCHSCHSVKTAKIDGAFGNRKKQGEGGV